MDTNDAAVAAIEFALNTDCALDFLRCWSEGEFDVIRKEWLECPQECFDGAEVTTETLANLAKEEMTLRIPNVDLRLLKQQRKQLILITGDDSILSTMTAKQQGALQGILNMLDSWSDRRLKHFGTSTGRLVGPQLAITQIDRGENPECDYKPTINKEKHFRPKPKRLDGKRSWKR